MLKNNNKKQSGPVPHKILSDRGVHLERSQQASENSNVNRGKTAFMWKNPSGQDVPVKIGQHCPKCKKRVRGMNHEQGSHHQGTVPKCGR